MLMLFRGLTIDSVLNLLSMVSRSYLSRLVYGPWSHGFVRTLPGTHTNNIVPVSSSMHGVLVRTPVPRQKVYSYTLKEDVLIWHYSNVPHNDMVNACVKNT